MHADLPYREVVSPAPHPSAAHAEPRPHADSNHDTYHGESEAPHKKRLHHHVIENLKHHLAAVIAVLIIAVVVPLCIRWYRTHIAGTTTTTSSSSSSTSTTTTAPSTPSVAKIVQDPAAATADMVTNGIGGDDSDDSRDDSGNAHAGMVFTGKGRYQLYRQGKITWRLDTDTGYACILLATEAEWRKQRVYSNGCDNQ
jgi:hypothetical protein